MLNPGTHRSCTWLQNTYRCQLPGTKDAKKKKNETNLNETSVSYLLHKFILMKEKPVVLLSWGRAKQCCLTPVSLEKEGLHAKQRSSQFSRNPHCCYCTARTAEHLRKAQKVLFAKSPFPGVLSFLPRSFVQARGKPRLHWARSYELFFSISA